MVQALLALVAVLVAAAIAIHWQRLKQEADLVREDFRKVVSAGANFHVAVGRCMGFLVVEVRQGGRLWDYQRKEFQAATDDADRALVKLGAAITLLNSSAPALSRTTNDFWREAGACHSLLGRIAGWAPHPHSPGEDNARVTIIPVVPEGDLRHAELAAALRTQLGAFSTAVDSLSNAVAQTLLQLFRRVTGVAYATYALLFVAFIVAAVLALFPRPTWTAHLQDDRVIWVDSASQQIKVAPLPGRQLIGDRHPVAQTPSIDAAPATSTSVGPPASSPPTKNPKIGATPRPR